MKIGVIGAGFIGRALARLARQHGHEVMIANSRGPHTLASTAIALHCQAGTVAEAARFGEVVVMAIPLHSIFALDATPFEGRIVLDANNYYPQRDGRIAELDGHQATTSGLLARHLKGAQVVKAFNAILQDDIEKDASPPGTPNRRALPIAGDDEHARRIAAQLVDQFGFDAVDAGLLDESWRFERAMPAYCVRLDAQELRAALAAAQRGVEVADGAWRAKRSAEHAAAVAATAAGPGSARQPVSFSGRGDLDIVDAQFHLGHGLDIAAALASMDALGIKAAIVDEFWGFDPAGQTQPHAALPGGVQRPLSPLALTASLQQPGRIAWIQRVVREDPQVAAWISVLATLPGCRGLRVSLLDEAERQAFDQGGWDEVLRAAQQAGLPVCVFSVDVARVAERTLRRFDDLQFVLDHCGWPRSTQSFDQALALARLPHVALKWSHVHRAFRRSDEPAQARRQGLLRAIEAYGPERVMWASDTDHEESNTSWGELLSAVRDESALSAEDKAWVLGRAARQLFRLPA